MEDFFITFIKTFFFNFCSSFVFIKIQKKNAINKNVKYLVIILDSIISITYAIIHERIGTQSTNIFTNFACYIVYILILSIKTKTKYKKIIIFTIISISFSFLSIITSSMIIFILINVLSLNFLEDSFLEYSFIGLIQIGLVYAFFEIRRFKNRFYIFGKQSIY